MNHPRSSRRARANALRQIDRWLSDRAGIPWESPSPPARARIDHALDEGAQSPIPLELPWLRPVRWGGLIAASLVLASVGVLGFISFRAGTPGHSRREASIRVPSPAPSAYSAAQAGPTAVAADSTRAASRSEAPEYIRPLLVEAELIRADTERAIGEVFSRFPILDRR